MRCYVPGSYLNPLQLFYFKGNSLFLIILRSYTLDTNLGMRCYDRKKKCKEWADAGECEKNPRAMLFYCKKSCQKAPCDREILRPPGTCNEPLGLSLDLKGKWSVPDSAFTATSTLAPGRKFV